MSYQLKITPRQRKAGRFIATVRRQIQKAYSEEKDAGRVNQSELAKELGVSRSVVSRRLRGLQNLTIRSIADLAWALDREIIFELKRPSTRTGGNNIETATSGIGQEMRAGGPATRTSDEHTLVA